MDSIQDVVKSNLCLGCGFCTISGIYEMKYSKSKGQYFPKQIKQDNKSEFQICPGKGYQIKNLAERLYATESHYSIDLGYVHKQFVVSSLSEDVLKNASSGGAMTQIVLCLLEKKIVEKVVVTKFINTEQGPRTKTFFTNDIEEILNSQGSKYCPVNMDSLIKDLEKYKHEKFAFVGTPCQIAALREIQITDNIISENLVLTIGNFCGGFKNYNNIRKIAQRHHVDYYKINYFRFRGDGQPGSLLMTDNDGHVYQADYPKYSGYSGYTKLLRCHLCIDATAELADIACGDAWIDKYLKDERTWSIVLCRNKFAFDVMQNMAEEQRIITQNISDEEICYSQRQNIKSKKYRYRSRNKLYKILGYQLPFYDSGFYETGLPLRTELKIFLIHKCKETIEKMGLYRFFRILVRKKY